MSLRIINIENAIYHVLLYGYFERAAQVYYAKEHEEGHLDVLNDVYTQGTQIALFENIRAKIRGNTYLSPSIIALVNSKIEKEGFYPFSIRFTPDEQYWFKYILKLDFPRLKALTEEYYKIHSHPIPDDLYQDLLKTYRNVPAIEFLREKLLKKLGIS